MTMLLPQQPSDVQKMVRKTQRKVVPDGSLLELREVEIQQIMNGTMVKEIVLELDPPAIDGTLPKDLSEVNQCVVCHNIYGNTHLELCVICGRYCSGGDCRVEIPPTPEVRAAICAGLIKPQPKFMCRHCYEESTMTFLDRLRHAFWRL